jgi:hypothetical protein
MTPIALTTDLTLFILTSFALIAAGPWLADFLGRHCGLAPVFARTWKIVQWAIVFLLASTGFGLVSRWSARLNHSHRMCVTVMPARKSLGRKSALGLGVAGMAQNARGH